LPEVKSQRCAGIGYAHKSDFTRFMTNKAPYYNFKSDFDGVNNHTPKYTFGESRCKFDKVFLESNKAIDMNIPGAGKYNYVTMFGKEAPKFSIVGKGRYPENSWKHYPGPGKYNSLSINPEGKYFKSNFRNATSIMFGISKGKRSSSIGNSLIKRIIIQAPGPTIMIL
jgi:hypothetical protein